MYGRSVASVRSPSDSIVNTLAALRDDSVYVKALQRRAASNEQIGSWSALSSAQEGTRYGFI